MDQAAFDGFLRHYRHLPAEDLAALDLRRGELVPEAIAALDNVLGDEAVRERVALVTDGGSAKDVGKAIVPKPLGLGLWLRLLPDATPLCPQVFVMTEANIFQPDDTPTKLAVLKR